MERIGNTVAFIPIRGGSKSIPLKNIRLMNKRPLVYWTLDAAVACKDIDTVVVSTDSDDIRAVVRKYGSEKIILVDRSDEVSTDTASTESVMIECAEKYEFETMILIQATSPLLRSEDLSRGIKVFSKNGIDSVLSVVRQKRFLWENRNGIATPLNYDPLHRPRRQEFSGYLVENGAFYITGRESLLRSGCRLSGNISSVEMCEESYVEIDEPTDWVIVESLLKRSLEESSSRQNSLKKIRCLLTDSDGVLTDGGMYYSEHGDELKKFNTKDGMGMALLRRAGFITGIITGEDIDLVRRRGEKMKVNELHLGIRNKMNVLDEICKKHTLSYDEIAYIGDDINDLEVLKHVGFGCTVQDGMRVLKETADYITEARGGQGAVREVVDMLLSASSS
ncbi:MAG: N-acylneuraminate cytidylyltransferase [Sphaerochaetaceae bacterium]|nr:N-acylneuraminate cytidylyltransferase [Sphaerochaetaceae bacterium]